MSTLIFPTPIPASFNLTSFQKGSGVTLSDAKSCPVNTSYTATSAAQKLVQLYPSLDDQTVWTSHAAIVSDCDEVIYGPIDATLRQFVHNLKSLCVVDDICLVSIVEKILCNNILNYRARYLEAKREIDQVNSINTKRWDAYYEAVNACNGAVRGVRALDQTKKCQIFDAIKTAHNAIKDINDDEAKLVRCALSEAVKNLCSGGASDNCSNIPVPTNLPLPCPCPPISCEVLANACVVIKVLSPASEGGAADNDGSPTCDETLWCDGCPNNAVRGRDVTIGGVRYDDNCLLPTGAEFDPKLLSSVGVDCSASMEKAVILTFRAGRNCVTGDLTTEDDGFPPVVIV